MSASGSRRLTIPTRRDITRRRLHRNTFGPKPQRFTEAVRKRRRVDAGTEFTARLPQSSELTAPEQAAEVTGQGACCRIGLRDKRLQPQHCFLDAAKTQKQPSRDLGDKWVAWSHLARAFAACECLGQFGLRASVVKEAACRVFFMM